MKRLSLLFITLAIVLSVGAQQRSSKRGVCWDEGTHQLSNATVDKMLPGVSWVYNWGPATKGNATNLGTADGMQFAPMAWNGVYDANRIRTYINTHKGGVKCLLGFNEPNFAAQSNMTPAQAAEKWPGLEALANELGVKLAAPALNFTGEKVGGKVWSPYEWLDEFIKQYKAKNGGKNPKLDYLTMHCYMKWYSANTWIATEYFYKDIFDPSKKDVYGKYPNIEAYLNDFKAANGHFPKMMLTEFCSWDNDDSGVNITKDFQIDQMTQKLQMMELSDLVEGYAWFMGNTGSGYNSFPFMSLFLTNNASSELSELGKVFVNMSSFDLNKYYTSGETIAAKDYVDASTDGVQVKLRSNTEAGSDIPLQISFCQGAWNKYLIDVPVDGKCTFTLHINTKNRVRAKYYIDDSTSGIQFYFTNTNGEWADMTVEINLKKGKHNIKFWNGAAENTDEYIVLMNSLKFVAPLVDGIEDVSNAEPVKGTVKVYSMNGVCMGEAESVNALGLPSGAYIIVMPSGEKKKIIIK